MFSSFLQKGRVGGSSKLSSGEGKQVFRLEGGEDANASWDSKMIFQVATVGYAVGLGSRKWSRSLGVVCVRGLARGVPLLRPSPAAESKGRKMNILNYKIMFIKKQDIQ